MKTLKEFSESRDKAASEDDKEALRGIFSEFFNQWLDLEGKLTLGEEVAYVNEGWRFRDILGKNIVNEAMEEIQEGRG